MVDEDRQGDELDDDVFEDDAPRSIFSALWFRVVVVVVVLGVIAAVAVPYVLEWMGPAPPTVASAPGPKVAQIPIPTTPPPPAAAPSPTASMPATEPQAPPAEPATPKMPPAGQAEKAEKKEPPVAAKPAAKPAPAKPAERQRQTAKTAPEATKIAAGTGTYWVQVGAFRDAEAAQRVAERLRARQYKVEESTTSAAVAAAAPAAPAPPAGPAAGGDLYDVFVSGGSPAEIGAKLTAKGLAAEAAEGGAIVKPSLPLRDAVALSKDLAADGFKVQVKRAGGSAAPAKSQAPPAPAVAAAGLHRVRVGPYPDRRTAIAALRELEAAGFKPFIARGDR